MNKQNTFNDFRFEGLDYKEASNKYLTMKRVNAEGTKCVVQLPVDGTENDEL